jgi:hypothetical protein
MTDHDETAKDALTTLGVGPAAKELYVAERGAIREWRARVLRSSSADDRRAC